MTGSCSAAAAAFLEPEKYRGAFIPVYDEMLTCDKLVETFTQVTGIKARCESRRRGHMQGREDPVRMLIAAQLGWITSLQLVDLRVCSLQHLLASTENRQHVKGLSSIRRAATGR